MEFEYKNNILLNDDMREVFGMALKVLGYSSNSTNPKEIEEAYLKLKELLPNVKMFYSESQKQVYLNEEVKLGMNFNGESFMASEENEAIKYVYPKEGILLWIDSLVIPKGAKNIDNAHAFINYLLKPEVSKVISEEIGYPSPNAKTLELLDEKTRNNRIIYPNEKDLLNGEFQIDVGDVLPIYEKYWEMLKTKN
ncbi:MAG: extracellular solute-binding protein [Aliarcobacter sp.]|nr:extracellular solute-binding protein [Aliarcobacter sp.]